MSMDEVSMDESVATRRKRLHMRAWRRGTKEMDLILGGFADARLSALDAARLDIFEALLAENDHDLYSWVTGQAEPPARFAPMIAEMAARTAG